MFIRLMHVSIHKFESAYIHLAIMGDKGNVARRFRADGYW